MKANVNFGRMTFCDVSGKNFAAIADKICRMGGLEGKEKKEVICEKIKVPLNNIGKTIRRDIVYVEDSGCRRHMLIGIEGHDIDECIKRAGAMFNVNIDDKDERRHVRLAKFYSFGYDVCIIAVNGPSFDNFDK